MSLSPTPSGFGACDAIHEEAVALGEQEFRVFRCSWGWCVKRGDAAFRSRTLFEAFEQAHGGRLDDGSIRRLVETLERGLNAEYARKRATVSEVVTFDPAQGARAALDDGPPGTVCGGSQ